MMDNRGHIAVEIAIVLVVILMISGIVLNMSEKMTNKAIKASEIENTQLMISEVIDNLINNPGVPDKWNEYKKGTPGLAIINENEEIIPNSVSYDKFTFLGKNYKKFVAEKIFDSKIKSSMELIPQESSISSVKIGDTHESADGSCYLCRLEGKGKCPHYGMEVFIQTHTPLINDSISCSDHVVFHDHYTGQKIDKTNINSLILDSSHRKKYGLSGEDDG
jgi:hypothetical protein